MVPLPAVGAEIYSANRVVGRVTSADCGYFVKKSLLMGYVEAGAATDGNTIHVVSAEGTKLAGVVHTRAIYDPKNTRAKTS
jgi:glycine cleavage system aminomethyltransferase T